MKRIHLLSIFLLSLCINACVNDEKNLFSESATERTDALIKEYSQLLESNVDGWKMEYYPETDQSMGGYNFFCRFDKGEVTIMGDFSLSANGEEVYPAGTEVISLYTLSTDQGPVLSFDTYSPIFHFFSEPKGTQDTDGYAGDYEFVIMKREENCVVMKGKKHGNTIILNKLSIPMQEALKQVLETQRIMQNTPYDRMDVDGKLMLFEISYGYRQMAVANEDGSDVQQRPFIFTEQGIKLYQPIAVNGELLQEFVLDKEQRTLSDVTGRIDVLRTPWIKILTKPEVQYMFDFDIVENHASMSDDLFELIKLADSKNVGESFTGMYIGKNHRGDTPAATVLCFTSQSGSSYYYPMYACEFTATDDNLLQIIPLYDQNSMMSWYPWCRSLAEYLESNSPYRLETPPTGSDNAVRCISANDENVWFELF